MKEDELKYCPFCGDGAEFFEERIYYVPFRNKSWKVVKCKSCDAVIIDTNPLHCPLDVYNTWNKRTYDWNPNSEKPKERGDYLCTLFDGTGTFVAICYWNETFGGGWQCLFEGEESYSPVGNVVVWMPLPEPYNFGDA